MAFWKKWTQEIWFSPKEEDDVVVDQFPPVQQPKPKTKKRKISNVSESTRRSSISNQSQSSSSSSSSSQKPDWKKYLLLDTRFRIAYVLLLCLIIGVILPSVISYYLGEYRADLGNCDTPTLYKFECLSGSSTPLSQAQCESVGCCYDSGSGTPKCFHKNPTRYTYQVEEILQDLPHKKVIQLKPERRSTDMFGNSMPPVKVVVRAVNRHHLIVQLLANGQPEDNYRLLNNDQQTPFSQTDFDVKLSTEKKESFSVVIKRTDTLEVLLDTSYGPLAITDEYVEMSTTVPSEYIYGLGQGEKRSMFKRNFNYGKTALYNRAGADSYHPFFMAASPFSGSFHGVFWDNPYPLEVQLSPATAVSFRSMGGSGVFHLFAGPTPAAVSKQFTQDIVGPAPMPPFWSLGLHLCRESDDPSVSRNTLQKMLDAGIGFDSDCIDSRLSGPGSGTADLERFPQALDYREWLRDLGKKFVLSQPPHVLDTNQYPDIPSWILHNATSEELEPGNRFESIVYYPSYPSSSIQLNWDAMLQPEGFNLIDNWPSNDVVGGGGKSNCLATDRPRSFTPEKIRGIITDKTVCLDAFHPSQGLEHLAVHNHYGVQHLEHYLSQSGDYRLLYLNRASALGNLGRAGSPGDDYTANWISMKMALVQVLEMGLFGVTLAGAPICGSLNSSAIYDNLDDLDEEQLCLRWYQLGLLLPFAHSTTKFNQRLRSPVDWSLNSQRILAGYIQHRYRLLPYFYTLFYQASVEGSPVVRPMWYEFPSDNETYPLSEQFMIGQSIMVCPAMIQVDSETNLPVSVYFPAGTWYDYYTGDWITSNSKGKGAVVMTGLHHVNMFVVNATVFVTQEPGTSAEQTRQSPYTVTTAFPINSVVHGWLYVDDGMTSDQSAHDLIRFNFTSDTFTMERLHSGFPGSESISTVVNQVRLFGLELKEDQVPAEAYYDPYTRLLEFNNLNFDWTLSDIYTLKFILNSDDHTQ